MPWSHFPSLFLIFISSFNRFFSAQFIASVGCAGAEATVKKKKKSLAMDFLSVWFGGIFVLSDGMERQDWNLIVGRPVNLYCIYQQLKKKYMYVPSPYSPGLANFWNYINKFVRSLTKFGRKGWSMFATGNKLQRTNFPRGLWKIPFNIQCIVLNINTEYFLMQLCVSLFER